MRRFPGSIAPAGVILSLLFAVPAAAGVCDQPIKHQLFFEASTSVDVPPQVLIAETREELEAIVESLGIEAPTVPDSGLRFRPRGAKVLVVIGAARANGCRSTEFLCVAEDDPIGTVQAVIEESFPGCGCVCTAVFQGSAVFFVAVPDFVDAADLVSIRRTFNCQSCAPCPVQNPDPVIGTGDVVIDPICSPPTVDIAD